MTPTVLFFSDFKNCFSQKTRIFAHIQFVGYEQLCLQTPHNCHTQTYLTKNEKKNNLYTLESYCGFYNWNKPVFRRHLEWIHRLCATH